jgi:predicted nucleic acid-binding protein
MYLLDTNVVSELARNRPNGAVTAWLGGITPADLFISAVTLGELQAGIELTRSQDPRKADELERWVDRIEQSTAVVPIDAPTFRTWARFMSRAPRQIELDALVAATAEVHRMTVVTRNVRDFTRFRVPLLNPFKRRQSPRSP